MNEVEHLSIYIDRLPGATYAFVASPENLPAWAAGLTGAEIIRDGAGWIAEAPFGKARITFVPLNSLGVLDHDVELESGVIVHNPMRVVPNGAGSEFIFTLFRQQGMSDAQFEADRQAVESDLKKLKQILESLR